MLQAIRAFLALRAADRRAAPRLADVKPYVRDDLASDVVRLTETCARRPRRSAPRSRARAPTQLRKDAAAAVVAGDYKGASALLGAAVAADPKDSARAGWRSPSSARRPTTRRPTAATTSSQRGQTAAYAAYQRASGAPQQAEALALLGNLFARHEMWRPALDAYRASLDRRDDEDTRKVYEDMREKHGFRIVDYKVDNESASPRICFNFSEPLGAQDRFRALRRGRRRRQRGDLDRGPADLRRGPQARRALRDRACARACPRRSASRC